MDTFNITTASTTTTATTAPTTTITTTTIISSTTTTAATTPTPTTSTAIKNVSLIVPSPDTSPTTISETPVAKRPKARHSPYPKPNPILLSSDRRSRKRKSLSWRPDDKLKEWHYFELIADERVNVSGVKSGADQQIDANVAGGSSSNALNKLQPSSIGDKMSNASVDPLRRSSDGKANEPNEPKLPVWRPLIMIDFTPELPSPGWNSIERSAQAERETYVLGAIDLPGQPSTLDEPDQQQQQLKLTSTPSSNIETNVPSGACPKVDSANGGDGTSSIKIIPTDNPEGMTSEYHGLYESEIVNGVRMPSDNPQAAVQAIAPFCNQQSQLLTGQFQQQLAQNPFGFQDLGAQFQQHTQMQLQFPFQQQPMMPFSNQQIQIQQQQQQQTAALPGPVTPWLNYPFNQVSENSHAHLFRRPAT